MRLIELVVASGGEVVGIGCIWNRGDFNLKDIPLISFGKRKIGILGRKRLSVLPKRNTIKQNLRTRINKYKKAHYALFLFNSLKNMIIYNRRI